VAGDPAEAAARARDAAAIGRELAVPDLEALGLAAEGLALVERGRLSEGMRRLDGAGALAGLEDFELAVTPTWVTCILISACEGVGDFDRAAQWCAAMRVMGERLGGGPTVGVCRTAYGQVLVTRGEWRAAERELVTAVRRAGGVAPGAGRPRPRPASASCAPARGARRRPASCSSAASPTPPPSWGSAPCRWTPATPRPPPRPPTARCAARSPTTCSPASRRRSCSSARCSPPATSPARPRPARRCPQAAARLGTPYLDGRATLVAAELRCRARPPAGRPARRRRTRSTASPLRRAVRGGPGARRAGG
jgi:hypothetical protein